jgi:N-methylhydantoinase B
LSQALPGQVSAGIGNLKVIAFSGMRDGGHWVHMEIFEGSYGGRSGLDGMDAVDTLYANTRNNPIEDIESHLPLRVTRYELARMPAAPANGAVASARCASSSILPRAAPRSRAKGMYSPPGGSPAANPGTRPSCG